MSDVFISYANEDRASARILADALANAGFSVWWDRDVPPGKTWHEVIGRELESAGCVIVLWSGESVKSRWVRDEADRAAARGCLLPVLVENIAVPLGFGQIQAADLSSWRGDPKDSNFLQVLRALEDLARTPKTRDAAQAPPGPPPQAARKRSLLPYAAIAIVIAAAVGLGWWLAHAPSRGAPQQAMQAMQDKPATNGYASLNATVTGIRFFESGTEAPPQSERAYTSEFHTGSIRYVDWELSLSFAATKDPKDFTIVATWIGPDGNLEGRGSMNAHVGAGWTSSSHWHGWGNANGFNFAPGTHTVILTVEGQEVARGTFRVMPAAA